MLTEAQIKLLDEAGFIVLDDIHPEIMKDEFNTLINSFSKPHQPAPQMIEIKPKLGYLPESSGGVARFYPHTDLAWHPTPPKYLIMYCLNMGNHHSGLPTITDVSKVLAEFSAQEKEMLQKTELFFPAPHSMVYNGYKGRILEDGRIRFNSRGIRQYLKGVFQKFFDGLIEYEQTLSIKKHSLWIIDNHRFCHGRTAIKEGFYTKRHLIRIYAG